MTIFFEIYLIELFQSHKNILFNACAICSQYLYRGIMYKNSIFMYLYLLLLLQNHYQKEFYCQNDVFFILSLHCPLKSYDFYMTENN